MLSTLMTPVTPTPARLALTLRPVPGPDGPAHTAIYYGMVGETDNFLALLAPEVRSDAALPTLARVLADGWEACFTPRAVPLYQPGTGALLVGGTIVRDGVTATCYKAYTPDAVASAGTPAQVVRALAATVRVLTR